MAGNAAETVIAANGSVWVAAVGTSFPATVTTSPGAGWTDLGYITEGGVKVKPKVEVASFGAWQSAYKIRTVITGRDLTIGFALRQWNETNLVLALGGGAVSGSGPYTYTPPQIGAALVERAVLVRWQDGSKNYDLKILKAMPVDLAEFGLMRTGMADLGVTLELHDDGDDTTAPYTIVTDDTNWA